MTDPAVVLGVVVAAVLVAATTAPFESLAWWAGWSGRRRELTRDVAQSLAAGRQPRQGATGSRYYVVFLSGIGTLSGDELLPAERGLLDSLRRELPAGGVVTNVFPYAVDGTPLTGQRAFAGFWRLMYRVKLRFGGVFTGVVNLRNLFYVLVSADRRYGPVVNYGLSREILKVLLRAGYDPARPRPVFLLGYSGGGQMSVGAAPYLKRTLGAPVDVVALGGVISADPGLTRIDRLTRIYGTVDVVQALGDWFLPPRWPRGLDPAWVRARREGRIALVPVGRIRHVGPGSYLEADGGSPDGESPRARSVRTIAAVVEDRLPGPA